jgi:hypothetical protein
VPPFLGPADGWAQARLCCAPPRLLPRGGCPVSPVVRSAGGRGSTTEGGHRGRDRLSLHPLSEKRLMQYLMQSKCFLRGGGGRPEPGRRPPTFPLLAALLMQFVSADVMRRQIEHLVKMAEMPQVRIHLLPFQAAVNAAATPGAPFGILDGRVPELSTVYVEHPVSSVFLGDREHLAQYNAAFEHLSAVALSPIALRGGRECYTKRDSLQLIQHCCTYCEGNPIHAFVAEVKLQ